MGELRIADLHGVLELVRSVSGASSTVDFHGHAVSNLRRLIPCEHASYDELDLAARSGRQIDDPAGFITFDIDWAMNNLLGEHPLVDHLAGGDGEPVQNGDLMSAREWRRNAWFNYCLRPTGRRHQIVFALHDTPPVLTAVALNRARRGFSERERTLLSLLRPHLTQARGDAQIRELLATGGDAAAGAIILTASLRIAALDSRASALLSAHYGTDAAPGGRLPEELERWAREQATRLDPALGEPILARPLHSSRSGARLTVRFLASAPEGPARLVLTERVHALDADQLARAGLTPRETEVLTLVARGLIDDAIAHQLAISPRTVHKHVQRIHVKLGVGGRTAAVARAIDLSAGAGSS